MKAIYALILTFAGLSAFGQSKIENLKSEAVSEGRRLYESEMASWYGTDLFLEQFKDRARLGSYFSYVEPNKATCIFFDKSEKPKVIGTIVFDKSFDLKKATVNLNERDFSKLESDYFDLRAAALKVISSDTIFKSYKNTNFNVVPLIDNREHKVYVLTGPAKGDVVIYGNDYLIAFDRKNNLKSSKKLHKGLIAIDYGDKDKTSIAAVHSHLPEFSDIMTATDVCTTMLYEKITGWERSEVMSKNYVSIWDCKTDTMKVQTREAYEKSLDEAVESKKK